MASLIGFIVAVGLIGAIYALFVSLVIDSADQTGDSIERQYDCDTTSYRMN